MFDPCDLLRALFAKRSQETRTRAAARTELVLTQLETREVPAAVDSTLINSWAGGQQGEIAITNPTGPAVSGGWTLEFDYSGQISQSWNTQLVSHVGNHYKFSDIGWN